MSCCTHPFLFHHRPLYTFVHDHWPSSHLVTTGPLLTETCLCCDISLTRWSRWELRLGNSGTMCFVTLFYPLWLRLFFRPLFSVIMPPLLPYLSRLHLHPQCLLSWRGRESSWRLGSLVLPWSGTSSHPLLSPVTFVFSCDPLTSSWMSGL